MEHRIPERRDAAISPSILPEREHLRRLENVFAKNPLYFVTCCVAQRKRLLDSADAASLLITTFRDARKVHGWAVGRYVIMPDHVHFFARPEPDAKQLSHFIRDWKKWTTTQLVRLPTFASLTSVWQSEFFDHLLRSADSYSEKWEYVRRNPVRAGLVGRAEDWRYSGECVPLTF